MDAIEITADELGTEESITSTVEETPSPSGEGTPTGEKRNSNELCNTDI